VLPVWDYGKEDRTLRWEMQKALRQLQGQSASEADAAVINHMLRKVEKAIAEREEEDL